MQLLCNLVYQERILLKLEFPCIKSKGSRQFQLISDEESIAQHLKRNDLQCFIWKQCMKRNLITPKLERRGWYMKDKKVLPVLQLLPTLTKRKSRKSINSSKHPNKSDDADDGDADDDDDDSIPRKKGPRFVLSHN